jgi:hypothetical protein
MRGGEVFGSLCFGWKGGGGQRVREEERARRCIDVRARGSCRAAAVTSTGARRGCALLHTDSSARTIRRMRFFVRKPTTSERGGGSGGVRARWSGNDARGARL